ncbi:cell wall metabolism sensor histidine kinase WalK [Clostridium sp. CAG:265]|uniref:sensor histidine kinase n=1 Tax=Clostridium sp. CAG:265 TaxID=1262787 RepID=UPI00033A5BC4|nr:HAMP domain-containing sensor histidine kinase [Clostridium sp. CAG:265]CDB75048.1 integral membrane sensor signal transduction histidine kinase [Clostridium sp. CAG:265]
MKKYKKANRRGSIFSLLINNYILFTVIIIISAILINNVSNYLIFGDYDATLGLTKKYQNYLKEEKFNKLNLKEITGEDGTIEILDENYNLIYSLGKDINKEKYNEDEINAIPNYRKDDTYLNIYDYYSENGESYKLIIAESYYSEGVISNSLKSTSKWFKVLDKNLNVILESDNAPAKKNYTEKEIIYMRGYYNNGLFIEKYQYINNDGIKRTAIIKSRELYTNSFFKKMNILTKIDFVVFGIAYIILVVIFVFVLRSKFYEPLEKLNKAMELLTEGKRKKPVDYSGPREFVDICDRFNIMVSKLEDSENQRKKLMNDKERMMADISHDLKTPITSIQGYAKALSDGIIVDEDKDKYIKIIYEKSKKLTELINIFHEYSKLEHPDFNLIFEKVDLSEYLRAYIALKYEDIVESGFNIEVDIPEEEMEIKIDKVQLQRVFDNILGNSIKHNEKGTNIYVSLKEKNDIYEIIIADDGKGISKDIANNIFEAFTVGDESRNSKQGSGLGLAIAKTIVDLHGGTIELEPESLKKFSTQFKIILKKNPKL